MGMSISSARRLKSLKSVEVKYFLLKRSRHESENIVWIF